VAVGQVINVYIEVTRDDDWVRCSGKCGQVGLEFGCEIAERYGVTGSIRRTVDVENSDAGLRKGNRGRNGFERFGCKGAEGVG